MRQKSNAQRERSAFNPSDLVRPNGNFFGFNYTIEEASVVLLPVPWDATTSYRRGTAFGPQAILDASLQLDFHDFDLPQAWLLGHATVPIASDIQAKNEKIRAIAETVINYLEGGGNVRDKAIEEQLALVNQASAVLNDWVYTQARELLNKDKQIGVVGGEHSVSLGLLAALAEKYREYGILQIDAHADLRQAYEGFIYSHASIMHNALQLPNISRLVQVGIRDICDEEIQRANSDRRIVRFDDYQLKANAYEGVIWARQCEEIIAALPQLVYVSFDIDGLSPEFCPHTGTPVPGGLDFNQAIYLIQKLVKAGKTIIGFDLCEVAPGDGDQWDGNVGARLLYKLSNLMYLSQVPFAI